MRPGTRLVAFALVLAVMVGLGAAVGSAVGPIDVGGADDHDPGVEVHDPHDGPPSGH